MRRTALLLVLAGCAAPAAMVAAPPLDPPGSAESKVVVYRPAGGRSPRIWAFHDGMEFVGFLPPGGALEFLCAPGEHLFLLRGTTEAAVRAELAAGKTYYLRAGARPEFLRLQLVLEPRGAADPETAAEIDEELAGCLRWQAVPREVDAYEQASWDEVAGRLAWYGGKGRAEGAVLRKEQGR